MKKSVHGSKKVSKNNERLFWRHSNIDYNIVQHFVMCILLPRPLCFIQGCKKLIISSITGTNEGQGAF